MLTDVHEQSHIDAILSARRVLQKQPIYLDTETTGLDFDAEVIDVAVINDRDEVLLDTLVRPGKPIPASVTAVHDITDDDVLTAPRFDTVWHGQLCAILSGSRLQYDQPIAIYNAAYDTRLIRQSLSQYDVRPRNLKSAFCVMELYAEFVGEWDSRRNSYRWHKLGAAAEQCGIAIDGAHRALADARTTRAIVHYIAAQETGL